MLPQSRAQLWQMVVTRNVILMGIGLALIGLTVLRLSYLFPEDWQATKETVKEIGTTLFGLGGLALLWELFARRSFMREVLDSVKLGEQVAEAGLQRICWDYLQEIPWKDLFDKSVTVDLFFSYAQTWRHANHSHIQRLACRKGARIRVILPDPDDRVTMEELARRFSYAQGKLIASIREAAAFYNDLPKTYPGCARVECRYVKCCPVTSLHVFDDSAVFSVHSHQLKRMQVPTLMVEAHRPVHTFLKEEFESLYTRSTPSVQEPEAEPVQTGVEGEVARANNNTSTGPLGV